MQKEDTIAKDNHTYARPWDVVMKHLHLKLAVDFDNKTLVGTAAITYVNPGLTDSIYLDIKNLNIYDIGLDNGESTEYKISGNDPPCLSIYRYHIQHFVTGIHFYIA